MYYVNKISPSFIRVCTFNINDDGGKYIMMEDFVVLDRYKKENG
jgi:hypothetical protein